MNDDTRLTLKAFLASILPNDAADMISYTRRDADGNEYDDLKIDPNTGTSFLEEDPTAVANHILGDYLEYLIENYGPNEYGISGGNETATTHDRGGVIPYSENTGAKEVFVPISNPSSDLGSSLVEYSNSGKFDDTGATDPAGQPITLDTIIEKTAGTDGNNLLKHITGAPLDVDGSVVPPERSRPIPNKAKSAIDSILGNNNRFSQSAARTNVYKDDGVSNSEFEDADNFTSQRGFGTYSKDDSTLSTNVSNDTLKDIAASILLRATGQDDSDSPSDAMSQNDHNWSNSATDYKDSQVAVGSKSVGSKGMRSKTADGFPEINDRTARSGRGAFNSTDGKNSYGSVYTSTNRFDGNDHSINTAIAVASLIGVVELANDIITDVVNSYTEGDLIAMGRGPMLLGSHGNQFPQRVRIIKNLIFTPTRFPYMKCVERGLLSLFNVPSLGPESSGVKTPISKLVLTDAAQDSYTVQGSPGYWHAIARSVTRQAGDFADAVADLAEEGEDITKESVYAFIKRLRASKLIAFFNMLAVVGDVSLKSGMGGSKSRGDAQDSFFNVDKLPDNAATRVSKSRSSTGNTTSALAWRQGSVPSMYLLPKGIIKAVIDMGTGGFGTNPIKAMLATNLADKTYMDRTAEGDKSRIKNDVVERLENLLDSEYCPFYFHDLRTNEVIAFHAFLTSLTDNFQPGYTDVPGYGRMDPVKIYKNTTRNIGLTFVVAATSQDDFDEMWFKINKLVTMVYPQWSEGALYKKLDDTSQELIQPFSQVLRSSPMIRLRVGDVVKTNYSKFNLARIFGVGTKAKGLKGAEDTNVFGGGLSFEALLPDGLQDALLEVFFAAYGSPLQYFGGGDAQLDIGVASADRALRAGASQLLVNGFSNPLLRELITNRFKDPDTQVNPFPKNSTTAGGLIRQAADFFQGGDGSLIEFGFPPLTVVEVKPTDGRPYTYTDANGNETLIRIARPMQGFITGRTTFDTSSPSDPHVRGTNPFEGETGFRDTRKFTNQRTVYDVKIIDLAAPDSIRGGTLKLAHSDIISDPSFLFNLLMLPALSLGGALDAVAEAITNTAAVASGIPADTIDLSVSDTAAFMSSYSNPIVKSFNHSRGRGLAGVMTRLNIKLLEQGVTWETDWNSRAPKLVKVEVGFSPIHDIAPGIDAEGFNRAPIYNVGRSMRFVSGDPYDDNGLASKFKFNEAGNAAVKSKLTSDEGD